MVSITIIGGSLFAVLSVAGVSCNVMFHNSLF